MRRPFRLQYSLSTLLLVVTIVCMTFSLFFMYRELRQVRLENQNYRDQFGFLTISDPNKLHSILIPSNENDSWRWRVYLPPGRSWKLRYIVNDVPPGDTFPSQHHYSEMGIPPGEQTVFAGVTHDLSGKRVFQVAIANKVAMRTDLEGKNGSWLDDGSGGLTWQTVGTSSTYSCASDVPLTLLRLRHQKQVAGVSTTYLPNSPSVPTDGFLVWIEDANRSPQASSNNTNTPKTP